MESVSELHRCSAAWHWHPQEHNQCSGSLIMNPSKSVCVLIIAMPPGISVLCTSVHKSWKPGGSALFCRPFQSASQQLLLLLLLLPYPLRSRLPVAHKLLSESMRQTQQGVCVCACVSLESIGLPQSFQTGITLLHWLQFPDWLSEYLIICLTQSSPPSLFPSPISSPFLPSALLTSPLCSPHLSCP